MKCSFFLFQPAKFVDSYENYVPTFQLFIKPVVEEVNLLLEENKADKLVWNGLVWLPGNRNSKLKFNQMNLDGPCGPTT